MPEPVRVRHAFEANREAGHSFLWITRGKNMLVANRPDEIARKIETNMLTTDTTQTLLVHTLLAAAVELDRYTRATAHLRTQRENGRHMSDAQRLRNMAKRYGWVQAAN